MHDGPRVECPDKALKVRLRPGAESLGELSNGNGQALGPAVVGYQYGKGSSLYLAARLAALNYEREISVNDKWTFAHNRPAAELLTSLVSRTLPGGPVLKAVQVPEKVLVTLHSQERAGMKQWIVHLLNATGVRLKPGQLVPARKSLPAFPALDRDLVFDLRLGAPCRGYIVSPDYSERREVSVAGTDGGYQRVTVPKDSLIAYATMCLTAGE